MAERRWWMDHVSEHGDVYDWLTDAEVLAEMDTEALIEELGRRKAVAVSTVRLSFEDARLANFCGHRQAYDLGFLTSTGQV